MADFSSAGTESQPTTPVAAPPPLRNSPSSLDSNVSSHQGPLQEAEESSITSSDWNSDSGGEFNNGQASETDDTGPLLNSDNAVPLSDKSNRADMKQQEQNQEREHEQRQEQELEQGDVMRILQDSDFQNAVTKCLAFQRGEFKNEPPAEQMRTMMKMSNQIDTFLSHFRSQNGRVSLAKRSPDELQKYEHQVQGLCSCAQVLASTMVNRATVWEKNLEKASSEEKFDSEEVLEQMERLECARSSRIKEELEREERDKEKREEIEHEELEQEIKQLSTERIEMEIQERVDRIVKLKEQEIRHDSSNHYAGQVKRVTEALEKLRKEKTDIEYEKGRIEDELMIKKKNQKIWKRKETNYKSQLRSQQEQIKEKEDSIRNLEVELQKMDKRCQELHESYLDEREYAEQVNKALLSQNPEEAERIPSKPSHQVEQTDAKTSAPMPASPLQARQDSGKAPLPHDRSASVSPQLADSPWLDSQSEQAKVDLQDELARAGYNSEEWSSTTASPTHTGNELQIAMDEPVAVNASFLAHHDDSRAASTRVPSPDEPVAANASFSAHEDDYQEHPHVSQATHSPKEASQQIPSAEAQIQLDQFSETAAGRLWTMKLFSTWSAGYHLQAWIDVICWLSFFLLKLLHSPCVFLYKRRLPLSSIPRLPISLPSIPRLPISLPSIPELCVPVTVIHTLSVLFPSLSIDSAPNPIRFQDANLHHLPRYRSAWASTISVPWARLLMKCPDSWSGLERVKWEELLHLQSYLEMQAFPMEAATRIVRQMLVFLTMHTYLACHEEKKMWLKANGQTREYLIWQVQGHMAFWVIPGVNPSLSWGKGRKAWVTFFMLISDWLFPLAQSLYRWKG
ncbi:hypothetical protein CDD81_1944 [Ophiocordyceps australis]|uniref:Uncharacterized protein n=1 Tax=Ophiocordyceps australis TaxID=1399860 RepID=A0A2C5XZ08_9HYPO|nr:hypothetical protein CDD81_1944 [Ophiocordyceps australis]